MRYIYPQDLKAKAHLWLWCLKDFCIIGVAALVSVVLFVQAHVVLPMALTLCYGVLTICVDDATILDFIKQAARFLITTQQYFEWR